MTQADLCKFNPRVSPFFLASCKISIIGTNIKHVSKHDLYGCPPVTKLDLFALPNSKYFETKDILKDEQSFTLFRRILKP